MQDAFGKGPETGIYKKHIKRTDTNMKTEDLRKLKDSCNLTTKQLSDLSGVPESTISRILSGQTDNPTFDTVCAIVKAMGGSLDTLSGIHQPEGHTAANSPPLIELYEKVVASKNKYIRYLFIVCCILIAVLVLIVVADVANGSIGFVQY